jgi:hypothetical protein
MEWHLSDTFFKVQRDNGTRKVPYNSKTHDPVFLVRAPSPTVPEVSPAGTRGLQYDKRTAKGCYKCIFGYCTVYLLQCLIIKEEIFINKLYKSLWIP